MFHVKKFYAVSFTSFAFVYKLFPVEALIIISQVWVNLVLDIIFYLCKIQPIIFGWYCYLFKLLKTFWHSVTTLIMNLNYNLLFLQHVIFVLVPWANILPHSQENILNQYFKVVFIEFIMGCVLLILTTNPFLNKESLYFV